MTTIDKTIFKQILRLTNKLIAIPSTEYNSQELHRVLHIARNELQDGFLIEEFEKNGVKSLLVANCASPTTHFKVILNAHLDVVPAPDDHYRPYEKDGRIYGRGSYDMKAAAAVMIILFREIAKNLPYPIALQLVTDEECGSPNGTAYQLEKGVRGDFVITGEAGSSFVIKNEAKGILWCKLIAGGVASHSAYPWLAKNPILRIQEIIALLQKHYPTPTNPLWETIATVTNVETSNTVANRVPPDCSVSVDIRYVKADSETFFQKLRTIIPSDIAIKIIQHTPAAYTPEDNPFVMLLKQKTERVLGRKAVMGGAYASSDIRLYNEVGCEGVEFGPLGANHHSDDDEWVDIKGLEHYYAILSDFLLSLEG